MTEIERAETTDPTARWSLQVRLGHAPDTDAGALIERLCGSAARRIVEHWLAHGGQLGDLSTTGAPDGWPDEVREKLNAAVRLVRLCDGHQAERPRGRSPTQMADYIARRHLPLHVEEFWLVLMTARTEVIAETRLHRGETTGVEVDLGELLRTAISHAAPIMTTWHNHPSGDARPSHDDIGLWNRIDELTAKINVTTLDHLIVTRPGGPWYSRLEHGEGSGGPRAASERRA